MTIHVSEIGLQFPLTVQGNSASLGGQNLTKVSFM